MEDLFKAMDKTLEDLEKSIDKISSLVEDLSYEVEQEQKEFERYKENINNNYKQISPYEMYNVSEDDFH